MPHTRKYFCSLAKDARRTRHVTCGFKAGQSPRGRIAWRMECAQTIAAGMSAIEPTVVVSMESSHVLGDSSPTHEIQ